MKTFFLTTLILIFSICTVQANDGAPVNSSDVKIFYGKSEIYSKADMDAALVVVNETFGKWQGCTMRDIRYYGDECNNEENLKWMNELREARKIDDKKFTQCIGFLSDFYTSKDAANHTTFNPESEYKNWQWWLARTDGGDWKLLTFGY